MEGTVGKLFVLSLVSFRCWTCLKHVHWAHFQSKWLNFCIWNYAKEYSTSYYKSLFPCSRQTNVLASLYIYLIRQFDVKYGWIFLRVTLYFDEPLGESQYKLTSKNIQPYSTSNCLISDLLPNEFKTCIKGKKFEDKI